MKKFILLAIFLAAQASISQETKQLGDFDEVKVFDRITVELIPSSENKIEISGKRRKEVEVVNNNGELKIRMSVEKLLKGEDVEAKLYYKKLKSIDASEGATIACAEQISQTQMEITAKEGAQIRLHLDLTKADVKSVTGGIIKLTGKADELDAKLGTGGILYAKELVTSRTEIDLTAGGVAEINATDFVDADVKAGGSIIIFGSPKEINQSTALGGSIEERKE